VPEYSLGNRSRVWAVVVRPFSTLCKALRRRLNAQGYVHRDSTWKRNDFDQSCVQSQALPSLPLSGLTASPDEVAYILPMPLEFLLDPRRLGLHLFRIDARRPYWKVGVGDQVPEDLLPPSRSRRLRASRDVQSAASTEEERIRALEVWGLSGWFLNRLAWRLGWMERPAPLAEPEG
jgi:hypothetical protein